MRYDKFCKLFLFVDNFFWILIGFDFIEIDVQFDYRYKYDLK